MFYRVRIRDKWYSFHRSYLKKKNLNKLQIDSFGIIFIQCFPNWMNEWTEWETAKWFRYLSHLKESDSYANLFSFVNLAYIYKKLFMILCTLKTTLAPIVSTFYLILWHFWETLSYFIDSLNKWLRTLIHLAAINLSD